MENRNQTHGIDPARTRSIDNLQRLYTVVVSLAITESLRRLLATQQVPPLSDIAAFISLLATIIPFYHGANRYLDATYVTGERSGPKSGALMIDFIAIFIEGLAFFILAILISETKAFFTILAVLFIFDAGWVCFTKLLGTEDDKSGPSYIWWAIVNVAFSIVIVISIWSNFFGLPFWKNDTVQLIILACAAILRTFLDYGQVWRFYYPLPTGVPDILPAPLPAPIPFSIRMKIVKEKKLNE